ncbi:hypothetical protein GCM10027515_28710 [Schumannella luteola]|uniref:YdhG-like domain-containing protein n=1 Tax=Schumannella luteola TaxID=472059 RepID=A0A852YDE8_9MICO|nr:DUF1801 domain-containing protein [Schumannella luteola]NYG99330.1 hypothetical protein [Schumannella luteola]TPX06061.1 DUF1801 domain-containing protein [Schumannella luteola]
MPDQTETFSADERKAMKTRAAELKKRENGDAEVRKIIDVMTDEEQAIALRIHEAILEQVPQLQPKLRYGQPAYYLDGTVLCFFMAASKYKTASSIFGFDDATRVRDGDMWPSSYAIQNLSTADEKRLLDLVKRAAG